MKKVLIFWRMVLRRSRGSHQSIFCAEADWM